MRKNNFNFISLILSGISFITSIFCIFNIISIKRDLGSFFEYFFEHECCGCCEDCDEDECE